MFQMRVNQWLRRLITPQTPIIASYDVLLLKRGWWKTETAYGDRYDTYI
jgi:hypothetical protein